VPSDGNCGLHAICKALNDGNDNEKTTLMVDIFYMFELRSLPNYWWSDEELAVIANYFGYDMYIFNEKDRTGIVFGQGVRPPLVLYSVNNNSHWTPGTKTTVPSSSIPENFTVIENISEVLSIRQIKIKIKGHLQMRSMGLRGGWIESYSGRRDGSHSSSSERRDGSLISSSSGRRVKSNSRKNNGSHSGGHDEGRDGSHSGKNNVSRNKRCDENRSEGRKYGSYTSGERDEGRIFRRDGNCLRLEEGRSGGERGNDYGKEKSYSGKSDESILAQYSSPVSGNSNSVTTTVKQELSLCVKLKKTLVRKTLKLCRWNWNKENKYKKFDLFDSENEGDDSEDVELDAIYSLRYTIPRDMLQYFFFKNEQKQLILEDAVTSRPLEPIINQFGPKEYQLDPTVEVECPLADIECPMADTDCPIADTDCPMADTNSPMADCCPISSFDCCPTTAVGCCSNAAVNCSHDSVDCQFNSDEFPLGSIDYPLGQIGKCPFQLSDCPCITSDYSFTPPDCPCNADDCPFKTTEYPCSEQWLSENYVGDLIDGYTFRQKKNMVVRLFNRVYNHTMVMSNNVMVRYLVKPKLAVKAPALALASMVVAPAVAASVVAASVVASPVVAASVKVAPTAATGVASLIMQVAPTVAAPAMVALMVEAPEVATPTMVATTIAVAPSGNDLVTAPINNDLAAARMKNDLVVASVGNDPVVM